MKTNTLSLILVSLLIGFAFLQPAHSGTNNTAFGDGALENNQGNNNTAFGHSPLRFNIFGRQNTATGAFALNKNDLGEDNTATGFQAMLESSTGNRNTANGAGALQHNDTVGNENTATGFQALFRNTHGFSNTASGARSLFNNTTGSRNMAAGSQALQKNTTGERNTAIGFSSLDQNTTGSFNVALGAGAGSGVITANDVICIGRAVDGVNVSGTCFIGNIRGVTTQNANALPVVIDGAGQLGTVASSERFKKDIAIMGQASEGILSLRPVTFHYKTDGENTPQFGLIAEEVAKVNPALVVPDKEGKPYTVRYDAVDTMLLNEFLKEHETVQEQGATITELKKQIDALTAGLQKVSAQLEASKPAPQVVNNP
jgi:Chaperone of endosialidase